MHEGAPNTGEKQGEVVYLRNLIDETSNIIQEEVRIMFYNKIEIDPMLSTCEKGFFVLQAVNLSMGSSSMLDMR